jgi:hypothetical protein
MKAFLAEDAPKVTKQNGLDAILAPAEARLKRHRWICRAPGADGLGLWDHNARGVRLIHSMAVEEDGNLWAHVSVSRSDGVMPSWEQTRDIFHEVAGDDALGIIVVAPKSEHVNIAEVSHVWHCLSMRPVPDFTHGRGTI